MAMMLITVGGLSPQQSCGQSVCKENAPQAQFMKVNSCTNSQAQVRGRGPVEGINQLCPSECFHM